jgi:hypothetical protein
MKLPLKMSLKNSNASSSSTAAAVALATIASGNYNADIAEDNTEEAPAAQEEMTDLPKVKKPVKKEVFLEVEPEIRREWEVMEKTQVRSSVWRHFLVYKDQKFPGAVCKHCYYEKKENPNYPPDSWEVRYGGSTANTSHLERHFRTHHKELYKKQCEEMGIPEAPPSTVKREKKRKLNEGEIENAALSDSSNSEEENDGIPSAKKFKVNATTAQPATTTSASNADGEEGEEQPANNSDAAKSLSFDYTKAWTAVSDEKKCRYPKSISLKNLLEEMNVAESKDLALLEKDQMILLSLLLKPAAQKTFRAALHL